jgi:hypothetical protein
VISRIYAGGHATYTDDAARRQLHADVVRFIQGATPGVKTGDSVEVAGAPQSAIVEEPQLATTHHQIRINGSALGHTARVGLIPIRNNDAGEVRGPPFTTRPSRRNFSSTNRRRYRKPRRGRLTSARRRGRSGTRSATMIAIASPQVLRSTPVCPPPASTAQD